MSRFLDVALEAVDAAESVIKKHYDPKGIDSEQKSDGSPVTIADKQAESEIVRIIKEHFSDHDILGEESGHDDSSSEYLWVIDPIDGTKNFTRGVPLFGTLLALIQNGQIIVGVSNMPMIGEKMWAEKEQGAYLNGETVSCSSTENMSDLYISSGGIHWLDKIGLRDKFLALRDRGFQLRTFGDVYQYHLVAQGKIDAAVDAYCKLYDVAPLKLIIEEAGGKATQLDGSNIDLNTKTCLASNGKLHTNLVNHFTT